MKSTRTIVSALAGAGLIAMVAPSFAADAPASPHTFTSNVGIYSQYIYRGITQTAAGRLRLCPRQRPVCRRVGLQHQLV
jgi:hypothetical protein